jgi:branched-chain amino acid transport system substrate-binding protein
MSSVFSNNPDAFPHNVFPEAQRLLSVLALSLCLALPCMAQNTAKPIRIGVLSDLSSIYSSIGGRGLVDAARMAVEDFGGTVNGRRIEILSFDTENKVDLATAKARQWFDVDGVDMITDMPTSGIAIAVSQLARQKKKIVMITSAGSSDLTGKDCSPYSVHWTYDTYALSTGTARALVRAGGDSWFFVSAGLSFGEALERDASDVIRAEGGKVLGGVRHPFGALDFSSPILQASTARAKVVGLANAGQDLIASVKQAHEFGLQQNGIRVAALLAFITDIKGIGLERAKGLFLTEAFYWDLNDTTRQWSGRFYRRNGSMPTMNQAGTYGAVMHYLKALQSATSHDADVVMKQIKALQVNDFMTTNGTVRADGRVLRDMYLFEVKAPHESIRDWDFYKLIASIPAQSAFRPLEDGVCVF